MLCVPREMCTDVKEKVNRFEKQRHFFLNGSTEVSAIPMSFQDFLCPCGLVPVCNKLFLLWIV